VLAEIGDQLGIVGRQPEPLAQRRFHLLLAAPAVVDFRQQPIRRRVRGIERQRLREMALGGGEAPAGQLDGAGREMGGRQFRRRRQRLLRLVFGGMQPLGGMQADGQQRVGVGVGRIRRQGLPQRLDRAGMVADAHQPPRQRQQMGRSRHGRSGWR
jgi:hypothetical protein